MPASSLADVVDSLLGKGAVLLGETSISLAGVDLVYLQLQLMLSSTANLVHGGRSPSPSIPDLGWSSAERHDAIPDDAPPSPTHPGERGAFMFDNIPSLHHPEESATKDPSPLPASTDESPEKGLARLALTVVELLRQTMERQAMRRVEAGGLTDDEVERMGVALMELEEKMAQLRGMFGLTEDETNVDLGPIGKVL